MTRPIGSSPGTNPSFLGLGPEESGYGPSTAVILPVPYEETASYGKGTVRGPEALLSASTQVELYDEELRQETHRIGIHTLPVVPQNPKGPEEMIRDIRRVIRRPLEDGKYPVLIGGEHTITLAPVLEISERVPSLGVLQLDAHADLRESYEGRRVCHATVMKRIVEEGIPTAAVGIRALSREEADLIEEKSRPTLFAREAENEADSVTDVIKRLPPKLFITIDLDVLDSSLMPATGTPEPGGLSWFPLLRILRRTAEMREIVGFDIVELAPIAGMPAPDFLAARLLYRMLGYVFPLQSR